MAASPTPQPQGAPDPNAGVSPADQQANPLQIAISKILEITDQIEKQNPVVQEEFTQIHDLLVKSLQKTMMSAQPQAGNPAPQAQ